MKKIWTECSWFFCGLLVISAFYIGIVIGSTNIPQEPSPVEEKIDSLIEVRDSLLKEVNALDSIKYEKIGEIYALDNDSTVKLFYKLVSNK